ncbi:MAG: hypothetical protein FJ279_31530 [Planctomycetes bacterium]|nr:hypothetical protein [Planctomycetota bacterium]MBM4079564.1 hypothetical protein [Planctomycetota bacterium]
MTHRQRALAAMRGQPVDRLPFIARMELWYDFHARAGTLPPRYRGWSLWDIQRDLDFGIFGRGGTLFKQSFDNVEVREKPHGLETVTEYVTPVGTLSTRHVWTPELQEAGIRSYRVEHLVKQSSDYDVGTYVVEHTRLTPTFDEFAAFDRKVGEDGLTLPFIGYCPMHSLMHDYVGYEKFYLDLCDYPAKVERLHEALLALHRQVWRLAADSPAYAIEYDGNFDEAMTPPPIYEKYFLPTHLECADILHRSGKLMVAHTDGEMKKLLPLVAQSGYDVAEAFTPKPMTSYTISDARRAWGDRVTIWGGIPTVVLTSTFTDAHFEAFMLDLFRQAAPGHRFILGFGDNVPTDAVFDRLPTIRHLLARHGRIPIVVRQ